MKRVLVLLITGFEEVEALTPIDYLRRAGIEVTSLGVSGREVVGSHDIHVLADKTFDELPPGEIYDAIVVPGGPGASKLAAHQGVRDLILAHSQAGSLVAAICAAPALVLGEACGLLSGRPFTCYPGYEAKVPGGHFRPERVVVDGQLLTSRAAGTAGEFSVAIVAKLAGEEAAKDLAAKVLLR